MRLHNPRTGVQVNVDDEDGYHLLGSGVYVKGPVPTPDDEDEDDDEPVKLTAAQRRAAAKAEKEAAEAAEREAAEKAAAEAAAAAAQNSGS